MGCFGSLPTREIQSGAGMLDRNAFTMLRGSGMLLPDGEPRTAGVVSQDRSRAWLLRRRRGRIQPPDSCRWVSNAPNEIPHCCLTGSRFNSVGASCDSDIAVSAGQDPRMPTPARIAQSVHLKSAR
ncbi:hypothetical protein MHPYR_450031 [uncultured Mycobacterium sp.]|uniref:Uncharacterized protein n=1 Tax=uncultured Mycobacterium sp. TaxID=171292 RepID=A0A1Y5PNW9_9MYCO|nr:hypothetical protein MHPYR_450031 [uncultured Mycobacterium sp.]